MTEKYCFSYVRFSSKSQKGNSSVDRQAPIAPQVAKEKGWTYREDWNAEDLGVSAYKGDNIATIETIIQSVKDGKIPQGSVMIIEAFDRFSRADLDTAEDLLKKALKAGLEIYVYRGGHHLTRDSINKPIERIIALLELANANEYSEKLSNRVQEGLKKHRKELVEGKASPCKVPGWINRETRKCNEKAATVDTLFDWYLKDFGVCEMARKLNKAGTKTLADSLLNGKKREWSQCTIYLTLRNRQVLGEQVVAGETIKGFYQAAVTEEKFLKVQAKLNDNIGKYTIQGERKDGKAFKINNVFSQVAFCAHCGKPIKVVPGSTGHRFKYVTCHGRFQKGEAGCKVEGNFRYDLLENSFAALLKNNPEKLIQDEQGNQSNNNIRVLQGWKLETEKQIANITEALTVKFNKALVLRQSELEEKLADFEKKIVLESANTVSVKGGLQTAKAIVAKLDKLATDTEFRRQVMGWIRQHVTRINVNREGLQAVFLFKNGYELQIDLETGAVIVGGQKIEYLDGDAWEDMTAKQIKLR